MAEGNYSQYAMNEFVFCSHFIFLFGAQIEDAPSHGYIVQCTAAAWNTRCNEMYVQNVINYSDIATSRHLRTINNNKGQKSKHTNTQHTHSPFGIRASLHPQCTNRN